jgi:hypothetical protein
MRAGLRVVGASRRAVFVHVELIATPKQAAYHVPRILARLASPMPARLHPRNGQRLDRRVPFEARLRRSLIVTRRRALDEHDKLLDKMLKDK